MSYPFDIKNYPDLPQKVRTWLTKEWMRTKGRGVPVGRPRKYPWDEWMDGKVHSALAGRDFHLSVRGFRDALRQKGYHSGMVAWSEAYEIGEPGPTGPIQFWVSFRFTPRQPLGPPSVQQPPVD